MTEDDAFKEIVETCHSMLDLHATPGPLPLRIRELLREHAELQVKALKTAQQLSSCNHTSKILSDQQERFIKKLQEDIEKLRNGKEMSDLRAELNRANESLTRAYKKLGEIRAVLGE